MTISNECERCGRTEGGLVPAQGEYVCTVCSVHDLVTLDLALTAD